MSKGKIVHIIYSGLGGHKDYVLNLIDDTNRENFEIVLFGIEKVPQSTLDELSAKGIKSCSVIKEKGFDIGAILKLRDKLSKYRFSHLFVHVNSVVFWAFLFSRFRSNKLYFVEHQANHLKSWQDWIHSRLGSLFSQRVVYLTDRYREQVKAKIGFFYSDRKARIIPTGISEDWFDQGGEVRSNPSVLRIGMQSRIVPIKDHPTLLKAFAKLRQEDNKEVELSIAGEGTSLESIKDLSRELGIEGRVKFLGHLSSNSIKEFLDSLDIYVHATHGETLSIAIIQACARKKPIIASDVEGVNNFIAEGETGLLYENGNANELREKLKLLIEDAAMRRRLADNSYKLAFSNYTTKIMRASYRDLVNRN